METNLLSHKTQPLSPFLSQALAKTPSQSELQRRGGGHQGMLHAHPISPKCEHYQPPLHQLPRAQLFIGTWRQGIQGSACPTDLCLLSEGNSRHLFCFLYAACPFPPGCYISTANYTESAAKRDPSPSTALLRKLTGETEKCVSRHFNHSDLNLEV